MIDLFKRAKQPRITIDGASICVWGPAGSPGKSTLAANLACELALAGNSVILLDLDTYSPAQSDLFGLVDHPPGLASAARLLAQDRLDQEQIRRLSAHFEVGEGHLSILTGLSSAARWPEISSEKTEGLISCASDYFDFVIVDVASHLESAVRQVGGVVDRNVASRSAISKCTLTIGIIAADPIGVRRFLDSADAVTGLASNLVLIANRLRTSVLGSDAKNQVKDTIQQFAGLDVATFIPADYESCDRALLEMVPLAMLKRSSPARQAIAQFARLNFATALTRKTRRVAKLG
jgi:MinD-like ATPase involved in chromosome partitioning or flagellar assembly